MCIVARLRKERRGAVENTVSTRNTVDNYVITEAGLRTRNYDNWILTTFRTPSESDGRDLVFAVRKNKALYVKESPRIIARR